MSIGYLFEIKSNKNECIFINFNLIKMIYSNKAGNGVVVLNDDFQIITNHSYDELIFKIKEFEENINTID